MKTYLLLKTSVALTLLGSTALLAGPGPQYWRDFGKSASAPAPTPTEPAQKSDRKPAAYCAMCKVEPIRQFVSALPNGKGPSQWVEVGQKHGCAGCTGTITTIRGKTTDTMERIAALCNPATMVCCK